MENNKPSRPQGLSIGIGLVFGVVLYVLTNEAVWIGVGIALARHAKFEVAVNRCSKALQVREVGS